MKLMKPILTAGAAVAMLCACGGRKSITIDQLKQKSGDSPYNHVWRKKIIVGGTKTINNGTPEKVDAEYEDRGSGSIVCVKTTGADISNIHVDNVLWNISGKGISAYIVNSFTPEQITKVKCFENPYTLDGRDLTAPTDPREFRWNNEFMMTYYYVEKIENNNKVVYDITFEHSGDVCND